MFHRCRARTVLGAETLQITHLGENALTTHILVDVSLADFHFKRVLDPVKDLAVLSDIKL